MTRRKELQAYDRTREYMWDSSKWKPSIRYPDIGQSLNEMEKT